VTVPHLRGACVDFYDRTRPLIEGRVGSTRAKFECVALPPRELDERFVEFDFAEVALPTYLLLREAGDEEFIGLPIFPYRAFFLANVLVNVTSGIERVQQLPGKRIATGGLHLAGTIWTRALLEADAGISTTDVRWFTRTSTVGSIRERLVSEIQTRVPIELVPEDDLDRMLEVGEIDAWIGSSPPPCHQRGSPAVRRLVPDYAFVERRFVEATGMLPIVHLIVLRADLYRRHPWLATELVDLFCRARELGLSALVNDGLFACGLPWIRRDLEELKTAFGGDPYMPGHQSNRATLGNFLGHAVKQGVTRERHSPEELFASVETSVMSGRPWPAAAAGFVA
jgi:4,5-dihydroxyphthalate decarboxylase